ncbi:DM13 domain-containing protein [Pseudarthrobacter raffinosi]|uniref:DM13 domain-containing protein n=1 Tax=Pseudarthrobacter raffinosi TaxID=2953651 RepID=UPI00208E619F|nr:MULTISPECIES: DM13 domain-containing protein [unclassified Pseudarthrobacter]MCO4238314.1 DM13 domain-containing protein [Pseudarthrobacter sp. MDT3-28]MCO4252414.1 DM13 domain-containing protein [Pseudarthrobacter sp. MDT3-9]MCO4264210.1 DM13 domain-containing protein [Pseudarthrobacter sp. MDT3-26]
MAGWLRRRQRSPRPSPQPEQRRYCRRRPKDFKPGYGWSVASVSGLIKGNQGNQVYQIPADVDLSKYPSVDLWCVQFSVSFGAAELVT